MTRTILARHALLPAALALLVICAWPTAAPASPAWLVLSRPWTGTGVNSISAFAPAGLVAAGPGGRVSLSLNGGATWLARGPNHQGSTANLLAVDFRDARHGVVAGEGGTLLVTDDGGQSWRSPSFSGPPPSVRLADVEVTAPAGYAVGASGRVLVTADGGESWTTLPAFTNADLVEVASAPDGTALIVAADGALYAGAGLLWDQVDLAGATALAVTTATAPVAQDGVPDFFASLGSTLVSSDDAAAFTTLAGAPDLARTPWSHVAWLGLPGRALLVAGPSGAADVYRSATGVWTLSATGVGVAVAAAAPGSQSVAYVLDQAGVPARTLSAGQTPATTTLSSSRVLAGGSVRFSATVRIAAPGDLLLQQRVSGGSWTTKRSVAWSAGKWGSSLGFDLSPRFTSSYRLAFAYGAAATQIASTVKVYVRPKLTPDKLRITLSRGTVYRFAGSIRPIVPGETVGLYTDRGGSWHKLTLGGSVKVSSSGRWESRLFGTPSVETYHLKAHVAASWRHEAAWSPVVTVTIR